MRKTSSKMDRTWKGLTVIVLVTIGVTGQPTTGTFTILQKCLGRLEDLTRCLCPFRWLWNASRHGKWIDSRTPNSSFIVPRVVKCWTQSWSTELWSGRRGLVSQVFGSQPLWPIHRDRFWEPSHHHGHPDTRSIWQWSWNGICRALQCFLLESIHEYLSALCGWEWDLAIHSQLEYLQHRDESFSHADCGAKIEDIAL